MRGRVSASGFRQGRLATMLACAIALCCACLGVALAAGCSSAQVNVTEESPHLTTSSMAASSDGDNAETSQRIDVLLSAGEGLEASGDIADDFTVLLNGAPVDGSVVKLDVTCEGDKVVFALSPGDDAQGGPGAGEYFAVYQGQISIASARDDGALPHLTSADGLTTVLPEAVEGTLPSGLAIEVESQTVGSEASNTPAQAQFEVTEPASVRAITWLSLDGGATKLLKHNHMFANADAETCAADLAKVINATGLYTAVCRGATIDVRANEVVDGQVIEPCIVEGFGVTGGEYDGSVE